MRFVITICILLLLRENLQAQNLLPNPGFNEKNICTEYEKPCAPKGWFSTPIVTFYLRTNMGYDGRNAVEYQAYDGDGKPRNFLQTGLLCPLKKDSSYILELAVYGECIDPYTVSAYFSAKDFLYFKGDPLKLQPAVSFTGREIAATDNRNWYKLSLPFKATGTERFMVIGNFSRERKYSECNDGERVVYTLDNITLRPFYAQQPLCAEAAAREKELYAIRPRHSDLQISMNEDKRKFWDNRKIVVDTLLLPDVLFETGKASINAKAEKILKQFLSDHPVRQMDSLRVEGHTDNVGAISKNDVLSRERAGNVAAYIRMAINYAPVPIRSIGWGSARPVASNATPAGRQKNRRVVLYLYRNEE